MTSTGSPDESLPRNHSRDAAVADPRFGRSPQTAVPRSAAGRRDRILTTLAWRAIGADRPDAESGAAVTSLRRRLIENYRQPWDQLLDSPESVRGWANST
jgi:hypothetical protein